VNQTIIVNTGQCFDVGQVIKDIDIRREYYNREFIRFEADRETKLRIYFLSVAICHQTHHLHHQELNLWGWDYIEYAFLQMFKRKHPFINPGYVSICNENDIVQYLKEAFSPDGKKENCSLVNLEERAGMLLEICKVIREKYNRSISVLVDSCEGWLINNGKGLYEVLAQFTAFSDPMKKKITFFLKLAEDAGLIRIKDPENLVPIMDYHMQRVLLRMGCVEILDAELKRKIVNREPMQSDDAIRGACILAVTLIAENSGHTIMKMNDFFWSLGRSCCNQSTLCQEKRCMKEPCTFFRILELPAHDKCYFQETCKGSEDENYRNLWEPVVDTHYY
jgi:hypothetical protein